MKVVGISKAELEKKFGKVDKKPVFVGKKEPVKEEEKKKEEK